MDPDGKAAQYTTGAGFNVGYEARVLYEAGELGFNMKTVRRLFVAAATGAIGGFGTTPFKAVSAGAVAGTTNNIHHQWEDNPCKAIDYSQAFRSGLFTAAGGLVGHGGGILGKNIYRPTPGGVIGSSVRNAPAANYGAHGTVFGIITGGTIGNQ